MINRWIITTVVTSYSAWVSVQCKCCAFIPLHAPPLNVLQQFAPHHPGSINTASSSHMNNLFRAPCSQPRHFSLGLSIYLRGQSAFILLPPFLSILSSSSACCKVFFFFLKTFMCLGEGSCWACIPYSSFALLHFHSMLLYMLPHKMAVPLLWASEQLLSTLHKVTSVVAAEEGSFSQPASQTFRLPLPCFVRSSQSAQLFEIFVSHKTTTTSKCPRWHLYFTLSKRY